MFKKYVTLLLLALISFGSMAANKWNAPLYLNNRAPLVTKPYIELPLGAIKPDGWLREQLVRMHQGLTGNLDSIYPHVMGPRNGWLGGDGDVWERGPYWIDGLLPLAYILDNKELKQKVQPWIEWALASQQPDGYFGPDTDREPEPGLQRTNAQDWWPKMVMLKVMQQYYSATGDERVISFMTNYFKYQLATLPTYPLGHWTFWGEQRGGDNLMVIHWLYNITGDEFLLELGELVHNQTFDWTRLFLNQDFFAHSRSIHCVNLAQGFKEPAIYYQQSNDPNHLLSLKKAVEYMRHSIAFPTGLWAGDELLRVGDPNQGSELCTTVEMMFSLENILQITGDTQWADHLERVAYNALPSQITDDFGARQYFQQVNQIEVTRDIRGFVTPHDHTDLLFGELTGYPCCTSNMHQGWPKFTQNLWYATSDQGVAKLVYAPSEVSLMVAGGKKLSVKEESHYPFDESIRMTLQFEDGTQEAAFPFHLRVPGWCKNPVLKINGVAVEQEACPGEIIVLHRVWKSQDVITIDLPMEIVISRWFDNGAVVERGPLIYSLKMHEKWKKNEFKSEAEVEKYGEWYYEVTSDTPWNYALPHDHLQEEVVSDKFAVVERDAGSSYPWSLENAPVTITTQGLRIPSWEVYNGSAGPIAYYTQMGKDTDGMDGIELIPYGCSTLRITIFPVRNK